MKKQVKKNHGQLEDDDKREYWVEDSRGQSCFRETKEDFYRCINAGFRGFILYPNGNLFWLPIK